MRPKYKFWRMSYRDKAQLPCNKVEFAAPGCYTLSRRDARAVEWDGLENRCAGNRTGGSNPPLSAICVLSTYAIRFRTLLRNGALQVLMRIFSWMEGDVAFHCEVPLRFLCKRSAFPNFALLRCCQVTEIFQRLSGCSDRRTAGYTHLEPCRRKPWLLSRSSNISLSD